MTSNLQPVTTAPANSPNSLGSLAERLKAKSQSDSIAIAQMTQHELSTLQQHLIALSANAVSTTQAAIESQQQQISIALTDHSSQIQSSASKISETLDSSNNQISQALTEAQQSIKEQGQQITQTIGKAATFVSAKLDSNRKTLEQQQSQLQAEIQLQTKRLVWLLKVPLLILVLASLLVSLSIAGVTWVWTQDRIQTATQAEQRALRAMRALDEARAKPPTPTPQPKRK